MIYMIMEVQYDALSYHTVFTIVILCRPTQQHVDDNFKYEIKVEKVHGILFPNKRFWLAFPQFLK